MGGLSLFIILLIGSATALLTDVEQQDSIFVLDATTVDIALHVDELDAETKIDPGEEFSIRPWIENKGSGNVYAFIELDIPTVKGVPIFTYETEAPWVLVDSYIGNGHHKYTYCYAYATDDTSSPVFPCPIEPASEMVYDGNGESMEDKPLMTTAIFSKVRSDTTYKLKLSIKAYAVTVDGVSGNAGDVWATVKDAQN